MLMLFIKIENTPDEQFQSGSEQNNEFTMCMLSVSSFQAAGKHGICFFDILSFF
jgi:hypothetical protein